MPFDSSDAKKIYIASAVGIVLILLIIVQLSQKQSYKYVHGSSIAVKTSQGLIKMRADAVAAKLAAINAEMQKFIDTNAPLRYELAIQLAMANLKQIIDANPKKNLCNLEKKASIVDQAMSDLVTYDDVKSAQAYNTIVEHDEIDHLTGEKAFMYLLKHMDITIDLLHNDICEDGIIDLEMLESLLHDMEEDLLTSGTLDASTGSEIGNRHDPYEVARVPLFIRDQGQLEGFDSHENFPKAGKKVTPLVNLGVHNKLQTRSESFRTNNNVLSHNMVSDEDLLLNCCGDNFNGYL